MGCQMKRLVVAVVAALGLAAGPKVGHATLTYTIWNGGGLSRTADFPMPSAASFASFSDDVTALNYFNDNPQGGSVTFADFFGASSAGTNLSPAQLSTTMSTIGDTVTTFIAITETYDLAAPLTSTLAHDDGGTIYLDGAGNGAQLCGSPAEDTETTQTCIFPAGLHTLTLLYTEDNGSPSILMVNLPPEVVVPEPATLGLLGGALAGFALLRHRLRGPIQAA
jgi:hypothetical protein